MGFEEARVISRFVIVAMFKDGLAEGVIGRDIDMALVSEGSGFDLPIGKAGARGEGNILMHRLKHLRLAEVGEVLVIHENLH